MYTHVYDTPPIYVYIKRNEVGDPIASYGRKAVVDNTRKILYI